MIEKTLYVTATGKDYETVNAQIKSEIDTQKTKLGTELIQKDTVFDITACLKDCGPAKIIGTGATYDEALINIEEQTGVRFTDPSVVEKYNLTISARFEFGYSVKEAKKKSTGSGPARDLDPKYQTLNNIF